MESLDGLSLTLSYLPVLRLEFPVDDRLEGEMRSFLQAGLSGGGGAVSRSAAGQMRPAGRGGPEGGCNDDDSLPDNAAVARRTTLLRST